MERLVWARSLARPRGQEERKAEFLVSRCSAWWVIRVQPRSWERLKLLWEDRTQAPNSGPEDLGGGRRLSPKRSILGLRLEGRGGADPGGTGQQMQRSRGVREPGAWERRDVWGRQGGLAERSHSSGQAQPGAATGPQTSWCPGSPCPPRTPS